MENNILALKTYVDGGIGDTPFPNAEGQIEIGSFRYDAKRMGGAPTISMSVYYPSCLDNEWTSKVYAEFNGERFFLKQTPTSSKNNEDVRYKHEITLISERAILDNVYFYDAVAQGETSVDDRPVSNSTKFTFFGDIHAFSKRLNASLRYSNLDYISMVDEGISSEEVLFSFEDMFFSNAIQEAYNLLGIPYYFVGKNIHFGYSDDVVIPAIEYGVDDALLSITKNNANYKTVNRVTGSGSSDNIPYYYPNSSPKGDIEVELQTSSPDLQVTIKDHERFCNEMQEGEYLKYVYIKDGIIKTRNQIVIKGQCTIKDKDGNDKVVGTNTYNPTEEMILVDGWKVHEPVPYEPTAEEILNREKEYKIEEIIRHDSSPEVNCFYIADQEMWLDKATRVGLKLRFDAEIANGRTNTTLWYEGTPFNLELANAVQMLNAIELYASACYDNTQMHIAYVKVMEDLETLKNYDYRTGYPEKLRF